MEIPLSRHLPGPLPPPAPTSALLGDLSLELALLRPLPVWVIVPAGHVVILKAGVELTHLGPGQGAGQACVGGGGRL